MKINCKRYDEIVDNFLGSPVLLGIQECDEKNLEIVMKMRRINLKQSKRTHQEKIYTRLDLRNGLTLKETMIMLEI